MNIRTLVDKLALTPSPTEAYAELNKLLKNGAPEEIEAFAQLLLTALTDIVVTLDTTLSYVSEEAFARLIERAVELMGEGGPSMAGGSVVDHASQQFPHLLAPYRERLFALQTKKRMYYRHWYWRGADEAGIAFLRAKVTSGKARTAGNARIARRAWECLLETEDQDAIAFALEQVSTVASAPLTKADLKVLAKRRIAPLPYTEACAHLIFPHGYIEDGPVWLSPGLHPTWHLPAQGAALRFGGAGSCTCGLCGEQLHHLLTLPEKHVFANGSESSLSLEVCLSCLGWEEPLLTYKYGDDGLPHGLEEGECTPEFVAEPLLETEVHLAPTPARWHRQDLSNGRQNLNRVGGAPSWTQDEHYPDCPECGERMHFLMQLDSNLPTADGDQWLWGSGGMGYAFRCAPCRTVGWLRQDT